MGCEPRYSDSVTWCIRGIALMRDRIVPDLELIRCAMLCPAYGTLSRHLHSHSCSARLCRQQTSGPPVHDHSKSPA
jgi:hypothetical protein